MRLSEDFYKSDNNDKNDDLNKKKKKDQSPPLFDNNGDTIFTKEGDEVSKSDLMLKVLKELAEHMSEDGNIEIIEESLDDEDLEDYTEEGCPLPDLIDDLLSASYDPKPFGVTWTSGDIIQFLKEYGYNVSPNSVESGEVMAVPGDVKLPKKYDPEKNYKKVFIDLCREKSIKMLLKKFREIDDDSDSKASDQ